MRMDELTMIFYKRKKKNEKIVIKRENTTNPNVKEKIKKDEEKKR